MATAADFGIISDQKLLDDKYLAFIMTHFLLIMSYQWYGIIKANVMGRLLNTYNIGSWDFILRHVVPRDFLCIG